jgi:glycosyltransferase involved in cell wall biosynthesis
MAGARHGGAEAFFVRLVSAMQRAGNRFDIEQKVVIRENAERAAILRTDGIEPMELPFGGFFDFRTANALKKLLAAFRPHIVMTWMNRATDKCPAGTADMDFIHVGRLGGYYDLKYYQSCDHLIGNTEDIVDYLVDCGWPRQRAHHLPNFVHEATAPPLSRSELFTPQGAPLIFALGRLHRNKAFDVLLAALSRVPNVYLWLAGDGPLRRDLEEEARRLGVKPRVRFLGWRDDVAALFAAADLFVCPSRHEPLGNVVVEAWAQAKPVIAADSLGPGTLIHDRETGVLVPVDDAPSMARAIEMVLGDEQLRGHIARQGREAFAAGFTEEAVVEQYMEFFDAVMAAREAEKKVAKDGNAEDAG